MLKIVISPAKKMNITDEFPCNATVPVFSDRADVLHGILKNKNIQELKTLWKCSDKLAEQNYQRLHAFSPDQAVTPALLAYEGIQYQ
ncbi:YaaA family protein, partial [Enterocloster bolteae]|nr:YaaA family protein [Enterocloster bolteae]